MSKLTESERDSRKLNWKKPDNWPSNRRPKFVRMEPFCYWVYPTTDHDDHLEVQGWLRCYL